MVNLHAVSWGLSEELFLSLILQPGNKQVMAKLLVGKDTKKPRYKGFLGLRMRNRNVMIQLSLMGNTLSFLQH